MRNMAKCDTEEVMCHLRSGTIVLASNGVDVDIVYLRFCEPVVDCITNLYPWKRIGYSTFLIWYTNELK